MKLMHYNKYDESTDEYETGKVVNVECDEGGFVTVYTGNCSWYIVLTAEEWAMICHPTILPI